MDITQGWGVTDYTGEPFGHGQPHWHAGVDLGYPSNTIVQFPEIKTGSGSGIAGWLQALGWDIAAVLENVQGILHHGVWNGSSYAPDPGGYGSHAATVTLRAGGTLGNVNLKQSFDIVLGHGSGWLNGDGAILLGGYPIIKVDSEGNSTGPHLHFEVRPEKGKYGTDIDPWAVLMGQEGTSVTNPAAGIGADVQAAADAIAGSITGAVHDAENIALGLALSGAGVLALGAAVVLAIRRGGTPTPPVPARPRPQRPSPRTTQPVQHPAARIARATRAAPAAPRIPTAPSQAVPTGRPR